MFLLSPPARVQRALRAALAIAVHAVCSSCSDAESQALFADAGADGADGSGPERAPVGRPVGRPDGEVTLVSWNPRHFPLTSKTIPRVIEILEGLAPDVV